MIAQMKIVKVHPWWQVAIDYRPISQEEVVNELIWIPSSIEQIEIVYPEI